MAREIPHLLRRELIERYPVPEPAPLRVRRDVGGHDRACHTGGRAAPVGRIAAIGHRLDMGDCSPKTTVGYRLSADGRRDPFDLSHLRWHVPALHGQPEQSHPSSLLHASKV